MADGFDTTARTFCPAFELLVIAYHEAAHAIVDFAVWPPNPVVRVTIIPTAEHDGVVELGERSEAWRFDADDDLAEAFLAEADTIADLAGYAGVEAFLGAGESLPLPPSWSGDHDNACSSALCTWDGVDGEWLHPCDYLERTREVLARPDVRLAVACLAGGPSATQVPDGRAGRGDRARLRCHPRAPGTAARLAGSRRGRRGRGLLVVALVRTSST